MLLPKDFINCINSINPNYPRIKTMRIVNGIMHSYSEFYRKYHTLEHIEHGLNLLEEVRDRCMDYSLVKYAWWYHDAICIPNTANNEEVSASTASFNGMQLGFSDDMILKIHGMVLSTKHDKVYAKSQDEQIIHDLDLAILGSNHYGRYRKQIEDEYVIFSPDKYNAGRLKVLQFFLDLKNIYCTEYFQDRFEKTARRNIQLEINALKVKKHFNK